jgi:osmotically-inducible protein OsmY
MFTFSHAANTKSTRLIAFLTLLSILQGCAAASVVAITAGASMATDRRSIGNQIDDQGIELEAYNEITKNKSLNDNTNLHVISLNGSVLLIGQAPNTYLRDQALKIINDIDGIVKIHNQIRIGNSLSITTQTNDAWITSKVKAALFSSDDVSFNDIKVITENAEVFLMGLVSTKEAETAVEITRNISGVNRVFKAFEYL